MAYVYRHIRLDKNEPFYIGIGKRKDRSWSNLGRNDMWHKIVKKTKYDVEILFENVEYDFAKQKEIEFIKLYGRKNIGTGSLCNMTDGGEGTLNAEAWNKGIPCSDETKKKISNANISKVYNDKYILDLNTGIFYHNIKEAAKYNNISYGTLRNRLQRNKKIKGDLIFV